MKPNQQTIESEILELEDNYDQQSEYTFSCIQGVQCRDFYWMSVLSFSQAKALFQPFYNRSQENKPLDLAQRTLDKKRGKKIAQYIIKALANAIGFYILLPIVVTLDIPADESYEFQSIEFGEGYEEYENNGLLVLPPGTTFWIPDGQHRIFGILLTLLEAFGLVQDETIGVMFVPDPGGKKRRQIFLDANQFGVKPNKSMFALLDHRDEISAISRAVLMQVPVFSDRTALEATNITLKSSDFFTLNALKDSCKLLLTGYEGNQEQRAIKFWSAIAKHHPDWQQLDQPGALDLRKTQLSFNALTLNALAMVGREQPGNDWIERLCKIDWRVSNPDWNRVCYFNERIVKNTATIRALAKYITLKTQ